MLCSFKAEINKTSEEQIELRPRRGFDQIQLLSEAVKLEQDYRLILFSKWKNIIVTNITLIPIILWWLIYGFIVIIFKLHSQFLIFNYETTIHSSVPRYRRIQYYQIILQWRDTGHLQPQTNGLELISLRQSKYHQETHLIYAMLGMSKTFTDMKIHPSIDLFWLTDNEQLQRSELPTNRTVTGTTWFLRECVSMSMSKGKESTLKIVCLNFKAQNMTTYLIL